MTTPPKTLLIACGALAREMLALIEANRWGHMTLECLPAKLHNRPEKIPDAVREKIADARGRFEEVELPVLVAPDELGVDRAAHEPERARRCTGTCTSGLRACPGVISRRRKGHA